MLTTRSDEDRNSDTSVKLKNTLTITYVVVPVGQHDDDVGVVIGGDDANLALKRRRVVRHGHVVATQRRRRVDDETVARTVDVVQTVECCVGGAKRSVISIFTSAHAHVTKSAN